MDSANLVLERTRAFRRVVVSWVAITTLWVSAAQAEPFVFPVRWLADAPSSVRTGGVYRAPVISEFRTLNWFYSSERPSLPGVLAAGGLVRFDPATLEYVPYMAESYTISKDKLVWTFKLRPGMKWSDGKPITADDWVTTWRIATDNAVQAVARDLFFISNQRITVARVDDLTLKIALPTVDAAALEVASFPPQPAHVFGAVYERDGAKGIRDLWTLAEKPENIVSSGPFKLASYRPGERVRLERNPYFGEWNKDSGGRALPYLDGFEYVIERDQTAALAQFLIGDLDSFTPRGADDLAQIKRTVDGGHLKAELRANVSPAASSTYLIFNWNRSSDPEKERLFRSADFRRAMSHLVHRKAMIELLYGGLGEPAYSSVYAVQRDLISPTLERFDFDPEAARNLLAKLGYARRNADGWLINRTGRVLEFDLITNAGNAIREGTMQIFADEAKKVGVKVNTRTVDFGTLVALKGAKGDDRSWDAMIGGYSGASLIFPFYEALETCDGTLVGYNGSGRCLQAWQNQVQALYARGRRELDAAKRRQIGFQIQDLESREQAYIWTVSPLAHFAWNARVHGEYPREIASALTGAREIALTWIGE